MRSFTLSAADDFEGWRDAARTAFQEGLSPEHVLFHVEGDQKSLLDGLGQHKANNAKSSSDAHSKKLIATTDFVALAKCVVCHSHEERFSLLYRMLCRLQKDKRLLSKMVDADVHRANVFAKEVRRDMHKMKAFVRFREAGISADETEQFVAWFEPTHHIVKATAPFFVRRFAGMNWSILTPKGCAHWNGKQLSFSAAVAKSMAPKEDALEDYWRSYYASIFNPARLKVSAMTSEMPKKYWKNLPEAALIPELVQKAQVREQLMLDSEPTVPIEAMMAHRQKPAERPKASRMRFETLDELNKDLSGCRMCPLWKPATQTVCGEGSPNSNLMLVGEQPGDQEDLRGLPFVGPAGQLLHNMLTETEVADAYITNALKHFKFEPRGKRRIHKSPSAGEIDHCRFWLKAEIELVAPKVIVALGASAIRGITGKRGLVSELRGKPIELDKNIRLVVTRHPSSILRAQTAEEKRFAQEQLLSDLRLAKSLVDTLPPE
jgi:DNA polymerase